MLVTHPLARDRRGFTLVELLTVVVIIGILAGLVTAAAIRVQSSVRKAAHAMELKQLEAALHAYKERFGEFPPDSAAGFDRHIRKAFPRFSGTAPGVPDSTTALMYWLGGVDQSGDFTGAGFSANPTNPFAAGGSRIGPFFEFDPERVDGLQYYPTVEAKDTADAGPIHYYRADSYGASENRAFQDSRTNDWINPRSFQILSPGLRGGVVAGGNPEFPDGLSEAHLNMMSNFTSGTMEDALP